MRYDFTAMLIVDYEEMIVKRGFLSQVIGQMIATNLSR